MIFDCDSTLAAVEGVDVLAADVGIEDEIAALTDAAMAGEVDLGEVYGARLERLKPSERAVASLRSAYKVHTVPDARHVISALRELDIEVYVVSGGLAEPVVEFAVHLGVDADNVRGVRAHYDELSGTWWQRHGAGEKDFAGVEEGALTRSDGKPEVIRDLLSGSTGASMLVGDGASDQRAAGSVDLFVGFGGATRRQYVEDRAPVYITAASLAPVCPLLPDRAGASACARPMRETPSRAGWR